MISNPNDATLPRANFNDYSGKLGDRRHWDDQKLVEQYKQISNLENYVFYLEKQLDRLTTLNPELRDRLDKKPDNFDAVKPSGSQVVDPAKVELLASTPLIKSYEQIMNQYEVELEKKSKLIAQMEADQQGIIQENSDLSQQIYVLRTKFSPDGAQIKDGSRILTADEEKIQTIQRDQMVELLKRNHDVLMEKYELVRRQHEALEKTSA